MKNESTILIVDDDSIGQRVLRSLLINQGYTLVFASNGAEALQKASQFIPDLILLDVMMPDMDGFEVCQRLRADAILAQVPIIMVTSLDDSYSRLMGLEMGADDFISKPFDRAELRARVRTITRLNRYRRLHQERIKFERVFELSPDGILIVSENGTIELANSAMRQLLGMKEGQETRNLKLYDFLPAEALSKCLTSLDKAITNSHKVEKCETIFVRLDGKRFPVELVAGYFEWHGKAALQLVIRDITERVQAQEQIEEQLKMLHALFSSTQKVAQSLELRLTLNLLLDQITAQLSLDAAEVLLFKPDACTLEYAAGRGFRNPPNYASASPFNLSDSPAGRVILEQRTISLANLALCKEKRSFLTLLKKENFVAYVALPLIAKGQIKGVLQVFNRSPLTLEAKWLEFLQTMAQQAASAIDNATLFEELQRTSLELSIAYDTTLEGWVKALDLRDKETEGHTQRVTEMTLRLAQAMGLSQKELLHIRRGALLHDIGKIGIPDDILHKPGPLNDSEWEIMRRHPIYAHQMLSPISFLRPALDIPYCHHERWDGSGYPRGLKGQQIPFSARLFAVVDVWDALSSKRPYRDPWPQEKVLTYLKNKAGKHFDPMVVKAHQLLIMRDIGVQGLPCQ